MNFLSITGIPSWQLFLSASLIFCRLAGVFLLAPLFSRASIPLSFRLILAIFLSLSLSIPLALHFPQTFLPSLVIQELAIGYFIGCFFALFVEGLTVSSEVLKQLTGFYTELTSLVLLGALFLFFALDGHHAAIRLLVDSFSFFSPGFYLSQSPALLSVGAKALVFPLFLFSLQAILIWIGSRLLPDPQWIQSFWPLRILLSLWMIATYFEGLAPLLKNLNLS